jgi:hypothetical protein
VLRCGSTCLFALIIPQAKHIGKKDSFIKRAIHSVESVDVCSWI